MLSKYYKKDIDSDSHHENKIARKKHSSSIRRLESIDAILDEDKAIILWVAGGLKPSALIIAQGDAYFKGESPVVLPQTVHDDIDAILHNLKLQYVKTSEIMEARELAGKERLQEVVRLFIAPHRTAAETLRTLFDDVEHNHTEIGYALGYPKTAVDAFASDKMLLLDEKPQKTDDVSEKNMKLLHHRLSKKHWRSEVQYLEEYGTYLKTISPSLYASLTESSFLLHPEYFNTIPFIGTLIRRKFEERARAASMVIPFNQNITVAIRTLNEAEKLQQLLEDIQAQDTAGSIEVVVCDNESNDETVTVAQSYGARVVTLPRDEFTYPKSMNLVVDAASNEYVFLTVGHARLIASNSLQTGLDEFKDAQVAAAYGHALPSVNASTIERYIAMGNTQFIKKRVVTKPELGFMAATGLMFRKSVWEELGRFDERFETGGEDGALGVQMLSKGYSVLDIPMLSTHHTHGLGLKDTFKQWKGWIQSSRPTTLNRSKLAQRRPDMRIEEK